MKFLRNIRCGLHNLAYWLPVIWQDRQWDQCFLLRILEHKLQAMERFFEEDGVGFTETSEEIAYCRKLTGQLVDDSYLTDALRPHEAKYGVARLILGEQHAGPFVEIKEIAVPELVGWAREREKAERQHIYERVEAQKQRDYHDLFTLMQKYIQGWWD